MSEFGSLDITLTLPAFDTNEWVGVHFDIQGDSGDSDSGLSVRVHESLIQIVSEPSGAVLDQIAFEAYLPDPEAMFNNDFLPLFEIVPDFVPQDGASFDEDETLRIVLQNNSVALYRNDSFLHSFYLDDIAYPEQDPVITILRSEGWAISPTVGVFVVELDDWREAIYLETQAVAISGISSLIQERPVNILGKVDGSIDFFYARDPDVLDVSANIIRQHDENEVDTQAASDIILEGRDVFAISYPDYADEVGYGFTILQLGSLDSGVKKAGRAIMKRAMEMAVAHAIRMRPDLRIEPSNALNIQYAPADTGTEVNRVVVVNSVSISINVETGTMTIDGRRSL